MLGNKIIKRIEERTLSGIDKDDNEFQDYSESYVNSLPFDVYGKGENVNLRLSGKMLAAMIFKGVGTSDLVVYFKDGESAAKAHGHINGGNNLPVRDFLGLPTDELRALFLEATKEVSRNSLNIDQVDFTDYIKEEVLSNVDIQ
jgi:hypothetical protein